MLNKHKDQLNIFPQNCFLLNVIEGKIKGRIEEAGRRGRRRISLQDTVKEKKG
jgi:hypothetical protein